MATLAVIYLFSPLIIVGLFMLGVNIKSKPKKRAV